MKFFMNLHNDESGQDLVEYALVLGAVILAVTAGSDSLSTALTNLFGRLNAKIDLLLK